MTLVVVSYITQELCNRIPHTHGWDTVLQAHLFNSNLKYIMLPHLSP